MTGEVQEGIQAADDAFDAGFSREVQTETPAPAPAEPQPTPEPTPAPTPEPEYAQITKTQFDELMAKAALIDEIKTSSQQTQDKVFGHIGALKQKVESLAASGAPVELSPEDFAELQEHYPEMSETFTKGLSKVLARIKGGSVPPAEIDKLVDERTAQFRTEQIDATLDSIFGESGDWRAEVNTDAYAKWHEQQPEDIKGLAVSKSLRDASKLMRLFAASKSATAAAPAPTPAPTEAPRQSARQRQLNATVNPRGAAVPAPASTDDDYFDQGFKGTHR